MMPAEHVEQFVSRKLLERLSQPLFAVVVSFTQQGDGNRDAISIDAQGSSCELPKCGT
jgi:hypothetical protein